MGPNEQNQHFSDLRQDICFSGGSINRKLDCSARFGPSSDQSSLPSIARSLPSDNKNKHTQMAAILKRTCDRQDTLFLTSGVNYSV